MDYCSRCNTYVNVDHLWLIGKNNVCGYCFQQLTNIAPCSSQSVGHTMFIQKLKQSLEKIEEIEKLEKAKEKIEEKTEWNQLLKEIDIIRL